MNKVKFTSLAASLVLAMALTFSCSSDSNDGGGGTQGGVSSSSDGGGLSSSVPDGNSSSDGGGDLSSSTPGVSSSSSGGGSEGKITKSKITGVSQKGPFVEGSTATLYELNEGFTQTGRSFKDIIADNKGSFEIKGVELISPYAMLEASGYYRNEVTGEVSKGPITLFAIADIREKDNVNVNLLTHLEYYRVLNLVEGGKSVAEAKKQAQKEILAVFGIDGNFESSEDMTIFGATEGDAALLAISVLLQSNLGEGEFSQRLTNFAQSLKESGKWENETAKAAIANWASTANLAVIRSNIIGWGLSSEVPDFGKYVTVYWTAVYSLGGCGSANNGEVKKDNRDIYRICKTGNWAVASALEYDTYQLSCSAANEGEIKKGNVSGEDYVCENKYWREATSVETDIQSICLASNEGEIKAGKATGTDYICKSKEWVVATEFERDTYQWSCSATNEWETKKGNVSDNVYICKSKVWQEASYKEKYCLENKCSYFTDARDKQRYSSVVIGKQTWMAENLNYNASGSKCYGNKDDNCDKYGKLYDWATAMGFASSCNDSECSSQITAKHRGICPSGWHLPTKEEWEVMTIYIGGEETEWRNLKATSGWDYNNGTDEYGFSALPGGDGDSYGRFSGVGGGGFWWSSSEGEDEFSSSESAYFWYMSYSNYYNRDNAGWSIDGKSLLLSVRCLQD